MSAKRYMIQLVNYGVDVDLLCREDDTRIKCAAEDIDVVLATDYDAIVTERDKLQRRCDLLTDAFNEAMATREARTQRAEAAEKERDSLREELGRAMKLLSQKYTPSDASMGAGSNRI